MVLIVLNYVALISGSHLAAYKYSDWRRCSCDDDDDEDDSDDHVFVI